MKLSDMMSKLDGVVERTGLELIYSEFIQQMGQYHVFLSYFEHYEVMIVEYSQVKDLSDPELEQFIKCKLIQTLTIFQDIIARDLDKLKEPGANPGGN